MSTLLAAAAASFGKFLSVYVLPAFFGWLLRHLQEVYKDWKQKKQSDAVVDEAQKARTPDEKDKAAKDFSDNY